MHSDRIALLVTDQPDLGAERESQINRVCRCHTVAVHDVANHSDPLLAIVCDVSLENALTIQLLRNPTSRYRQTGSPLLCLLREDTWRSRIQADALGAAEVLNPGVSAELLVETLVRVAGLDPPTSGPPLIAPELAGVQKTYRVLTDMMGAVARDCPIDRPGVEAAARLVVQTIAEAGIRKWLDVVGPMMMRPINTACSSPVLQPRLLSTSTSRLMIASFLRRRLWSMTWEKPKFRFRS